MNDPNIKSSEEMAEAVAPALTEAIAAADSLALSSDSQIESAQASSEVPQVAPEVSQDLQAPSEISQAVPEAAQPTPETAQSTPAPPPPTPIFNDPNFKWKYPEAAPIPPGVDDEVWNKIYTAADSRMYNKHGKDANNSRKFRQSGETHILALRMLQERRDKEAAGIPPRATAQPRKSVIKKPTKQASSSSLRDTTVPFDSLSISEKIKSEGRARKASSAIPASASTTPGPSTQPTGSPAPMALNTEKALPKKKQTIKKPQAAKKQSAADGSRSTSQAGQVFDPTTASSPADSAESSGDDDSLYCICRRPDDHRLMIECVDCKEWFHPPCMNILECDARSGLVDRFVCNSCTREGHKTTYIPMCRNFNNVEVKCRTPARVSADPPSQYCSEECKMSFWRRVKSVMRKDDAESKGGALSAQEFAELLHAAPTLDAFKTLGKQPRLPRPDNRPEDYHLGLDYLNAEEKAELDKLSAEKHAIMRNIELFKQRQKLVLMVVERADAAAKLLILPGVNKGPKPVLCGYDPRLALDDQPFEKWLDSEEGKAAFANKVIGPRTDETKHLNARVYAPGTVPPAGPPIPKGLEAFSDICLSTTRCKHVDWRNVHIEDAVESQRPLHQKKQKCEKKITEVLDCAEEREATKEYHAHNTVERVG